MAPVVHDHRPVSPIQPHWGRRPAAVLFLCATLLLLFTAPAAARVRLLASGPRSGTVGGELREALEKAGVHQGHLVVQVSRGRPAWAVTVIFSRSAGGPVLVRQRLAAPHGQVAPAAVQRLARRAAAALAHPAAVHPPTVHNRPAVQPPPVDTPPPPAPAERPAQPEQPAKQPPEPPPPAEPEPVPTVPAKTPERAEDLGFKVTSEPAGEPNAGTVRAEPRGIPRDRLVLRLDAGFGLAKRHFLLDSGIAATDYATGLYSQIAVHGELYPLQLVTSSAIARLGIRLGYEASAGLSTDMKVGAEPARSFGNSLRRFWGGLTYALPRFFESRYAPTFDVRAGIGYSAFEIEQNPVIQDLTYTVFAAGAGVAVAARRWLGFGLSGEYRGVLRSWSPSFTNFNMYAAAIQGVALEGAVRGRVLGGLGYKVTFTFERVTGDLASKPDSGLPADISLTVRDQYYCINFALTYEL